jgi:hypothetical protein
LQLERLVKRIKRYFCEKRLTGAVFLEVVKAFDTVSIDGLLYKLTFLNFPSYIVHTISCLKDRTSKRPSRRLRHTANHATRVDQGGLISPVLFTPYFKENPSHHVELPLYAYDTAIIATSRKPTLLVSYLEA